MLILNRFQARDSGNRTIRDSSFCASKPHTLTKVETANQISLHKQFLERPWRIPWAQVPSNKPWATYGHKRQTIFLNFRLQEAMEVEQKFKHCKNTEIPHLASLLSGQKWIIIWIFGFISLGCWSVKWWDPLGPLKQFPENVGEYHLVKHLESIQDRKAHLNRLYNLCFGWLVCSGWGFCLSLAWEAPVWCSRTTRAV